MPRAATKSPAPTNPLFPHEDEEFIEITGYPEYLVSTYGRVFSVRRRKFLTPAAHGNNVALRVTISVDGRVTTLPVAPTVLTAFGRRPIRRNATPRYKDGDESNCALSNLDWA